jgi:curved DNA-binding protein CbpA
MTDTTPDTSENLYEILGVSEEATTDDVRRAYVRLVRKHRPDEHPELFRKINQAKEILSDPQRRSEYDQLRRYGDQVNELVEEAEGVISSNPQRAVRLLKEAVAIAPELFMPRYLLSHAFIQVEEFMSAETQLRRLLQKSPENASLHYNLAGCLKMQGMTEAAEASLNRALELNPHYHDAYVLLSRVHLDKGEISEATQTLERAILLNGSEDVNDLPVLTQLMTIHLLVDNGPAFARVHERIQATIRDSEDAHFAVAKLYDLAFEFCQASNYADAYKIIQCARHPLVTDEKLRGAVEEATVQIGTRADATRLATDAQIPKTVQAYVVWKYLDGDGKIDHLRDHIIEALEVEVGTNPALAANVQRQFRSRYPRLAEEEGEFLQFLADRAAGTPPYPGNVGGRVNVRESPPRKSGAVSVAGCLLMLACGVVLQIVIPVPVIGFAIGLFVGALVAAALKL